MEASPVEVERIRELALNRGAHNAKIIPPSSVAVGEWVRLKCKFGCDGYSRSLTCPPFSPEPSTTRKVLDEYEVLILLHLPGNWAHLNDIAADLEREVFLRGFHKVYSMASGPCRFCDPCPMQYPCRHADKARSSMEACGIDVYQTARNAGFTIEVARNHDSPTKYFALLLVE